MIFQCIREFKGYKMPGGNKNEPDLGSDLIRNKESKLVSHNLWPTKDTKILFNFSGVMMSHCRTVLLEYRIKFLDKNVHLGCQGVW